MTPQELAAALDALKLTAFDAGELLGHDQRTIRRWLDSTARIPPTAAIVVRALASGLMTVADVRALARKPDRRNRQG